MINTCKVCGCTERKACPGGCYWIRKDLCSECAESHRFGIFNPKGEKKFEGMYKSKEECISDYFKGNTINWRGMPSEGWRCKKLS